MRMKMLATTLVCLAAAGARAQCPRDNPTPLVHVVFEECGALKPSMKVKIDDTTRNAVQQGDHYEANYNRHPVDATMDIVVPEFSDVRKCCFRADEFSINENDCYVEFTVTCDKPSWTLTIDSGTAVRMERAHRNDLGDRQCSRDGLDALRALSARDDAILTVPVSAAGIKVTLSEILPRPEFDFKITITDLLQQAGRSYDRNRLLELLKIELGRRTIPGSLSPAAEPLVELIKPTLPNSVTVKRQ